MQHQQIEALGAEALQAPLGGHADVVAVVALAAQPRVGEAREALGAVALALVEVVPDRPDQAEALAICALDRASEQAIGLAGAVGIGAHHGVDPIAGSKQREQALILQGLAKMHEASSAPCADRSGGRVNGHRTFSLAWRIVIGALSGS